MSQPVQTIELVDRLACTSRTHAKLQRIDSMLAVTHRCSDMGCPDAVYARDTGQLCIHYWFVFDPDRRCFSYFEPNPNVRRDRIAS